MPKFDYYCDGCYETKQSGKGEVGFFACSCGGTYRLQKAPVAQTFTPYYNESHNVQVNTMRDEIRMKKKFGGVLGDYTAQQRRMNETRKNREEIISERYASIGVKYPKGQKVTFDEKNHRFIPRHA